MSHVQHCEGRPHSIPRPAPPQPDTQGRGSPWGHGGPVKARPKARRAGAARGVGETTADQHEGAPTQAPSRRPWALGRPLRLPRESYRPLEHTREPLSHEEGGTPRPRGRGCTSKSPAAGGGRTNGPWAVWLPRTVQSTGRHRDGEQGGGCQGLGRGRGDRRQGTGCPSGPTGRAATGQRRRWHNARLSRMPPGSSLYVVDFLLHECQVHKKA